MTKLPSRPATASDVTSRLREAITRGRLTPNERLIEADLAGQYRVNRAHIRTALAMLDQEGLVVRERNRGARVRAISDAEALEIAGTRLVIETMVARQAAERIDAAARKALRAVEADMRAAVAAEDYGRFSECNAALHREIQGIAGNATATRILDTLKSHLVRLQYRVILLPGRPQSSLAEHRAVIDAICKGDGAAAEKAMRRHMESFTRLLAQAIDAVRHGGI
ncbi:MAG TPA: GntR family transcriptional regulator [Pseudolabrys sp.]|jgi:DNA-binding GntR family transcriptional regulator|nr:GntR family transcriptional regulator [Pseudolabrys sp.]